MVKKIGLPKKARCKNLVGNGASWMKCRKTGQNCPFQRWCTKNRIFEFTGPVDGCSISKDSSDK